MFHDNKYLILEPRYKVLFHSFFQISSYQGRNQLSTNIE